MSFLIFPNQLFELKYFPDNIKINNIHILEEPVLYGFREEKLNFNKLKLVLHRASMKYYESYLKDNKLSKSIYYHEFNDLNTNKGYSNIKKNINDDIYTFELNDHYLEKKISKLFPGIKYLHNPNFLVTTEQLNQYYNSNKSKKTIVMAHFYNWVKDKINVLTETKSYDTENRNPLPESVKIPVLDRIKPLDKSFLSEAIEYINNHKILKDNCGPNNLELKNCWFPVTHKGSKEWLLGFIKKKLNKFGTYQDAIRNDQSFMFHSLIAPMFNIGLLSPHQIVEEVLKVKDDSKIGINNIEGFLRQIIGWREYQRYCYLFYYDAMTKPNVFNNHRKLGTALYDGSTGLPPVDDAIKGAFEYGYIHHIQRLMVMGNIFNLINLDPYESYKWFMEFSLDSYDWLMIQNVYSMGMWVDGGLSMRKPYISTAGYVIKMSNYKDSKANHEWVEIWRCLFYNKIANNKDIFRKTPYIFQLKGYDKMTTVEHKHIKEVSEEFIEKVTK